MKSKSFCLSASVLVSILSKYLTYEFSRIISLKEVYKLPAGGNAV
jgi:hypothetical protein